MHAHKTTALMGFAHPVDDAQATFRAALNALARPGTIERVAIPAEYPAGLAAAAVALALTLADHDTPVWLAETDGALADYLRFHAGCPITAEPGDAVFALARPQDMPALAAFRAGDDETPERSATLIWSLESLAGGIPRSLSGPGIQKSALLTVQSLPEDFDDQWAANQALFPTGVDLFLAAGDRLIGLPRTLTIGSEAACTSQ